MKTRFQKFSNSIYLAVFEMHNLYIMWLCALRFVTREVNMDASSLLYSNFLHAKTSLFVFGATIAESRWQVISICSCFIRD